MTDDRKADNSGEVIEDPTFVKKAAVDRLMKQIEAERNPYHGMAAVFGGGGFAHHRLIDIILLVLDPEVRKLLEERLNLEYAGQGASDGPS